MKQIKSNKKPFFRFIKSIGKLFIRKPKFIYVEELPETASILISNHSASSGPATYEMFFPRNIRMWGTHEMCESFKQRWTYLNKIYFHQKKKRSKFMSFILATFLTPIMAQFYKGMQIIPTYPDLRMRKSLKLSIVELEKGTNILIYPENSSDGYHEMLTHYFGGFWVLAKQYYKTTGKDIHIIPMYYHKKSRTIAVGKSVSYLQLAQMKLNRAQASELFLQKTNALFTDVIQPTLKK